MNDQTTEKTDKFHIPGWVIKLALLFVIVAILAAGYYGYLTPLKDVLDSDELALTYKSTTVTPYRALKALFIFGVMMWVAAVLAGWVDRYIHGVQSWNANTRALVAKLLQIAIFTIIFLAALDTIGINLTALTVLGGAVGIGIGFGLQRITSNFIAGLILLYEKSIQAGDLVELDDGTLGIVSQTSSRYTLITTYEGKEIMIPNEDFIISRVVNWTYSDDKARIEIPVLVAFDSDLDLVESLLLDAAKSYDGALKEPEPFCVIDRYDESGVRFLLYFWIGNVTQGRLMHKSKVIHNVNRRLRDNGIVIPLPQRDLHIREGERKTD